VQQHTSTALSPTANATTRSIEIWSGINEKVADEMFQAVLQEQDKAGKITHLRHG